MANIKEHGTFRPVLPLPFKFTPNLSERIPLDKGRDLAVQYGVAPLLAPLFDFTPNANSLGSLPGGSSGAATSPQPLSASTSYSSVTIPSQYMPSIPSTLAPPPILPGSALLLLNQGRAQGLFTPTTSGVIPTRPASHASLAPNNFSGGSFQHTIPLSTSTPPPNAQTLKRNRSEADADTLVDGQGGFTSAFPVHPHALDPAADIQMSDGSRPPSTGARLNGEEGPSPAKRLRKEMTAPPNTTWQRTQTNPKSVGKADFRISALSPQLPSSTGSRPPSSMSSITNGKQKQTLPVDDVSTTRFASKPPVSYSLDPTAPLKDLRRAAVLAAICHHDDPGPVLSLLREIASDNPSSLIDVDVIIDDQGHTSLHLAASMARLHVVETLIGNGADIHRGNYLGETPLMRACLATHNADQQTFHTLVTYLHPSIRTLDTSRKSVVHHVVALAGVKGRAIAARYYLDQIFLWIAENQAGDFKSIVDLQDEHGDTALNIAARVGNRSLVRTLLDVGANRLLPNKLGLRPGDFGVETEASEIRSRHIVMLKSSLLGVEWRTASRRYPLVTTIRASCPCAEESRCDCW